MIQPFQLRERLENFAERLKKRGQDFTQDLHDIINDDELRKSTQKELDDALHEAKKLSKEVGELFKQGKKEAAEELKKRSAQLKELEKALSSRLNEIESRLHERLRSVPNIPHESVPLGKNDTENVEIERSGKTVSLGESAMPHWELAKKYDLIDFELGVKVTGAGFPIYKGKGAILQRALVNFFLDQNIKAGYQEVIPPLFVNEDSAFGTGQLPDKEGQMYHITADNLYCIPTSEVPVTNMYRGDIIDEDQLPICNTAYTPCFRREAGSYGKDVRGLNRLHQFDKVEVVVIEHPDRSYDRLDKMVQHVGSLVKALELPYRVVRLCGGDLGFASALTYDFEVWSAAQERWLEVSSVSNFESFQANRLKLRYRPSDGGKPQLCHTLNGSSLALPRILAALLENNQDENGILIPYVLRPYTRFERIS
jgi:seryl-tRNA synthetase